ncbi:hypothetical protein N1851_028134 [Merluccius polli]|uniref:Uncharacterized protein n=1 Tax=Merluccius polli TaxID=89951 RepID=A0AA47NRS5_MERPO|nr:hypothetical protein N1851_028134 [Merluccius polli]
MCPRRAALSRTHSLAFTAVFFFFHPSFALSESRKRRRRKKSYSNCEENFILPPSPLIHFRIKISAQKGLELLQQHPALKDQTKLKTRNWNLGTWRDVVLKDTIQAATWCQLQSFKDSVSLPEVIGMEGWEQMAASTERKSDDGGDEEKNVLHTDYELFCVEMMDRRKPEVKHLCRATRLQCSLMMQHNGGLGSYGGGDGDVGRQSVKREWRPPH